jgi:hypothetical protein
MEHIIQQTGDTSGVEFSFPKQDGCDSGQWSDIRPDNPSRLIFGGLEQSGSLLSWRMA